MKTSTTSIIQFAVLTMSMLLTPASYADRVKVKLFDGGLPAIEKPCQALAPHGF